MQCLSRHRGGVQRCRSEPGGYCMCAERERAVRAMGAGSRRWAWGGGDDGKVDQSLPPRAAMARFAVTFEAPHIDDSFEP